MAGQKLVIKNLRRTSSDTLWRTRQPIKVVQSSVFMRVGNFIEHPACLPCAAAGGVEPEKGIVEEGRRSSGYAGGDDGGVEPFADVERGLSSP